MTFEQNHFAADAHMIRGTFVPLSAAACAGSKAVIAIAAAKAVAVKLVGLCPT